MNNGVPNEINNLTFETMREVSDCSRPLSMSIQILRDALYAAYLFGKEAAQKERKEQADQDAQETLSLPHPL